MQGGTKLYATSVEGHLSLGTALRGVLFSIPTVLLFLILWLTSPPPRRAIAFSGVFVVSGLWAVVVSGVRVAAQWEQGVVLRLGKFKDVRGPGVFYIVPVIEVVQFIDTRTLVINIPRQKVITRDNVPAEIDSALFFLVQDPEKAVTSIRDFQFAISQYAQAALRDVIGGLTLDELLAERERIQEQILEVVEEKIRAWGLHIDSVRLQDIELPEDLKRMMSRQASAEREKRATITKAEGDKMAAESLAQAAALMENYPAAMELRTLQTIDGLGASPSNTVILFPVEMVDVLKKLKAKEYGN
jgi:regulator of protease activity HflC (stomatin/prohibitin superfamily)